MFEGFDTETIKWKRRHEEEGDLLRLCPPNLPGLDVGCGCDPLWRESPVWFQVDTGFTIGEIYDDSYRRKYNADAAALPFTDGQFRTVFASHVLEHVIDPLAAVAEWWRVLAPGGRLVIQVPHRDLYELGGRLPSRWNGDHKSMWMPFKGVDNDPLTCGLSDVIREATGLLPNTLRVLDRDHVLPTNDTPARGEYSIEAIVMKPYNDVRVAFDSLPNVTNPETGEYYPTQDWVVAENAYPYYAKVTEILKPASLLEIGSFLGFGLIAFALGVGPKNGFQLTSVDNESYIAGSRELCAANVLAALDFKGSSYSLEHFADLSEIGQPYGRFDLIHVDAHHNKEDALHDMTAAWAWKPKVMLVDDYLFIDAVKEAVDWFATRNRLNYIVIPSYRGWAAFGDPESLDAIKSGFGL